MWSPTCNYNTCTRGRRARFLILPMMGAWRPKHVEWLCRNKTCTVLHQVGVSFDVAIYYETLSISKAALSDSSIWTQRCVRFQTATHFFFMHSVTVSSQRDKWASIIRHHCCPWRKIIMVVQKFLLSQKTGRMTERPKIAKTQQYSSLLFLTAPSLFIIRLCTNKICT